MKKKLVIDARMVGPHGHGISKYLEGLLSSFKDEDSVTQEFLKLLKVSSLAEVDVTCLIRPGCPSDSPVRKFKTMVSDESCYSPKSCWNLPRQLTSLSADLFFNPTFASYLYLPCPYIQTVHDLNHLHFGTWAQKLYYSSLLKRSIRQAARVFTVSKTMRNEIAEWAKVEPQRILVTYNQFEARAKLSPEIVDQVLKRFGLKSKQYFFSVLNSKPHKNARFLIDAYLAYRSASVPRTQVLRDWTAAFTQNSALISSSEVLFPLVLTLNSGEISKSDSENAVIPTGSLKDHELGALYQECAGFYFPSLYEGFGRPPVEAALAGVSFITTSKIPVHLEAEEFSKAEFNFLSV